VRVAVAVLLAQREILYTTQQNRREFWNVCTRPRGANGFGMSVPETVSALRLIDGVFARLPDIATSGPQWDALVRRHRVVGRAVHDAQLVALMIVHGVTHILTLNVTDFARYAEVTAVHPQAVAAAA